MDEPTPPASAQPAHPTVPSADDSVRLAKVELRRELRGRRKERAAAASPAERAVAARRVAEAVTAYLHERTVAGSAPEVCRVAAFVALPTEPPTDALIAALRSAGHEVIVPILLPDKALEWQGVDTSTVGSGERLGQGALGSCDLIVTPAMAVDRHGHRLGQGGGSYDRALVHARATTPVLALVWDDEAPREDATTAGVTPGAEHPLPVEPHDRRVDGIVTPERGVRRISPSV